MFQLIARHLLHTLNIIVVESFTTPHHYCPMSVQPLPALTVTMKKDHIYNGLPVCAICERVNCYTVNFGNMLTLPVTYGKMFLDRKAAVGVWPAAEVKNEARLGEGK